MLQIEFLEETEDVFDLTVDGNENFFANDILIHNCIEIELMTSEEKTAVCCLSSHNLKYWDEYKDNSQFFLDVMEMLDNVLQRFIDDAPPQLHRSVLSAVEERSVGLGVMGYHTYLQQNMIPFGSPEAEEINRQIFDKIHEQVEFANKTLGASRGEPKLLKGTGYRFAHTTALAPTATNALICGNVSPSIEPWRANAYRQDTLSGTFIQKNKELDDLIRRMEVEGRCDYAKTMLQIVESEGSIQKIDCFTDHEKKVFETAPEIDQMWLIRQAGDRQKKIDQGQSLNIFIYPDIKISDLHKIHFEAWKRGIKGMYYLRSEKLANTDTVGKKVALVKIEQLPVNEEECLACQA